MTGKGFEIATIPADPAAAAMPIQRPASVARVSFAFCETSMNVMTALTASTHQRRGYDEAEEIEHLTLRKDCHTHTCVYRELHPR